LIFQLLRWNNLKIKSFIKSSFFFPKNKFDAEKIKQVWKKNQTAGPCKPVGLPIFFGSAPVYTFLFRFVCAAVSCTDRTRYMKWFIPQSWRFRNLQEGLLWGNIGICSWRWRGNWRRLRRIWRKNHRELELVKASWNWFSIWIVLMCSNTFVFWVSENCSSTGPIFFFIEFKWWIAHMRVRWKGWLPCWRDWA
jgi:hypothetical protein